MKIKILSAIASICLVPMVSHSQLYDFDIFGSANGYDVSANVILDFTTPGDLTITLENTTAESVGSYIDEFYLLRPVGGGSTMQLDDTVNDPDWSLANSLDTQFNNLFSGDHNDYFGAEWSGGNSDAGGRIVVPEPTGEDTNPRYFYFSYSGVLNNTNWTPDGDPVMFMRWQGIGEGTGDGPESAKGFITTSSIPGFEPAVPEPSETAAIALLGLGCLLLIRRRLIKRQTK